MRKRLESMLAEYGPVALAVYLVIFGLVLGGFATAIHLGFDVESAGGSLGTLGAAWVATKVTQPARIAVTLVLTPLVSKVVRRDKADVNPVADAE